MAMDMNYERWIRRERRIRLRILRSSPEIQTTGIYRSCSTCEELCLCHEQVCPNCDRSEIIERRVESAEAELKERIRCKSRFAHLA